MNVMYGQRNQFGSEYVKLWGTAEDTNGAMRPLAIELAPGVTIALEDVRVLV